MQKVKKYSERRAIRKEIKKVLEELEKTEVTSGKYSELVTRLAELKELDDWRIDVKTVFVNIVYIGGLWLVLDYEKLDVITGKAFGMLKKRA